MTIFDTGGFQSVWNAVGDGVTQTFPFAFDIFDTFELFVVIEGQLQVAGEGYIFNDNSITFTTPPAAGYQIFVGRATQVDQSKDWRAFGPFQADKTEFAVDKLIVIKQEAAEWRAWCHLSVSTTSSVVTINNTKGDGTDILVWNDATDVAEGYAGAFSAIVNEGILPARNSPDSVEKRVFFAWNGGGGGNPFPAGE